MEATDLTTSEGPLQFGRREPGRTYADRPAAFGIAVQGDGRVALVRVEKPEGTWRDLPGGAVEAGEDELAALTREFGEETGLKVRPGALVARAAQYFLKTDGTPVNNRGGHYLVTVEAAHPALKIEPDHTLEWWRPLEALEVLRHDSHAWALAAWMRSRR
jgi:8-oxo-dGTP diphosphatase